MEIEDLQQPKGGFAKVHSDTIELLAKWMSKERVEGDTDLDILFFLDNLWDETYEKERIRAGFSKAGIMANKRVINAAILQEYNSK